MRRVTPVLTNKIGKMLFGTGVLVSVNDEVALVPAAADTQ